MSGVANFVIVWLIPVVIGVAYARRLIGVARGTRRGRIRIRRAGRARRCPGHTRSLWS